RQFSGIPPELVAHVGCFISSAGHPGGGISRTLDPWDGADRDARRLVSQIRKRGHRAGTGLSVWRHCRSDEFGADISRVGGNDALENQVHDAVAGGVIWGQ